MLLSGWIVPAAAKTLEVGMAVSLTGFLSNYDGQFINGVKLATKRLNDAGGIAGRQVVLHMLDNASNATTGVTVTNQLLNEYNVSVMLNGVSSAQNAAILPIVARAKVPMIIISQLPPDPVWAFLASPTNEKLADLQLQFAVQKLKAKKIAIVYSSTPYGQIGGNLLNSGAKALGLDVVFSEAVAGSVTDMTPQLAKIKDAGPDVVLDFLTGSTHIVEAKSAATVGLTVPLVMSVDDTTTLQKATAAYANIYFIASPSQAYPNISDAALKAEYEVFLGDFKKQGLDSAGLSGAAYGWDAVTILAKGVETSGAFEGEALRAGLERSKVQGTVATYQFSPSDHTGQLNAPTAFQIGKIKGDAVDIVFSVK